VKHFSESTVSEVLAVLHDVEGNSIGLISPVSGPPANEPLRKLRASPGGLNLFPQSIDASNLW